MALKIEDYGIIGDTETVALVGRNGSIDWLCLPRFDSGACFAALLGDEGNGCWKISPGEEVTASRRRYVPGTLVLETEFETRSGCVRLVDCMPPRDQAPNLVRVMQGVRGKVKVQMRLTIRFDYGSVEPWIRQLDGRLEAIGGPDALSLWCEVETHTEGVAIVSEFEVSEGQSVPFVLLWHPSHQEPTNGTDALEGIEQTKKWWQSWSSQIQNGDGEWHSAVERSLITLKALTYAPTGGMVAAATTSLPEYIGSVRNWDYRFCWLRDATFTLCALAEAGFTQEACAWRDWLLRAVAGSPAKLQILYGVAGERRLDEWEVPWLSGYENSRPVRIGNAASHQFQLDVYGEVMDAMHQARSAGLHPEETVWHLQRDLMEFLESAWHKPDFGIWEVRGPRRQFTHSKVMAWVAFDRAIRAVERFGLEGEVDRWKRQRDLLREEICAKGFDSQKNCFTQEYGSSELDASLLMLPLLGFLPPHDPRIQGTIRAIEEELVVDGFVYRYRPEIAPELNDLPPHEGTFIFCTFWLADCYVLSGRRQEGRELFERLLSIRNDLGLLAEQYDPHSKRMLGNFPQAFSHVGLINTARSFSKSGGMARRRSEGES